MADLTEKQRQFFEAVKKTPKKPLKRQHRLPPGALSIRDYCMKTGESDREVRRQIHGQRLPAKKIDGRVYILTGGASADDAPQQAAADMLTLNQQLKQAQVERMRQQIASERKQIAEDAVELVKDRIVETLCQLREGYADCDLSPDQAAKMEQVFERIIGNLKQINL